jgi:hypothetical protein
VRGCGTGGRSGVPAFVPGRSVGGRADVARRARNVALVREPAGFKFGLA